MQGRTDLYTGTNVHVILEQYDSGAEPLSGFTTPSNQTNLTNGDSDTRGVNGVHTNGNLTPHAKTTDPDSDIRGDNGIQTNGTLKPLADESRRRLFVFSANDKSSLTTQMHEMGQC